LASYLGSKSNQKILFIFDEPTTGLHFHDVQRLLSAFDQLIQIGHSVLIVEHNLDVIRNADWVIDLGPDAGINGGQLVYAGVPSGLKTAENSQTGRFLE
jgi:excinuclease ABC subunit A